MSSSNSLSIAVLPGDGIGPEVMAPCLEVIDAVASRVGDISLTFDQVDAGAACYRDHGDALPNETMDAARDADAILLAAMGMPDIRYPDGTEIAPQLDIRFELGLYAGVRPVRSIPGLPGPLADPRAQALDFVLIRESTEGLFASHGKGTIEDDREARDTMVITREVSEKLFNFSFELARKRKAAGHRGCLTCVDKANVFTSFAFFRSIFDQCATRNSDILADHAYVDATALNLVRNPWVYDVAVTENMFGDILSDLGAALIGGMGMAPSADIGDSNAVFQPCHGSAPDIVGSGKANPTAMFLSAAMMLEWLGDQHERPAYGKAGALLTAAVDKAFSGGSLVPFELGGESGTSKVTNAVLAAIDQVWDGSDLVATMGNMR
ncbi:isocitrate/isopropylmalate dehydrogenase family protein [Pelagibius sp. Alg239-R121]|uniref:isocitrate/isopropylmalate dehydrogenase family protein n=1 Tax=Pelagibius sp. Alg239-R121 TaxID=2993448 RepID=UPI0024A764A9|nr:isocitrate/isopropylmalate dehydrogenase family protein [Pelagibius sp. Alg239-R121]